MELGTVEYRYQMYNLRRTHCFFPNIFLPKIAPMPISTSLPVRKFSQEEFGQVAYKVVGHAFEVHSALGKRFHESVYQRTLQQIIGPRAVSEYAITISHGRFLKILYVDLLVDAGCPFELKAVSKLTDDHISQLIQYLMLLDVCHGKLINFGAEKVEHQFVNCHESLHHRQQFDVDRHNWGNSLDSELFEKTVVAIVSDWGTGLSRSLYEDACVQLLGGSEQLEQFTATFWNEKPTGRQPVKLLNEGIAFEITCKRDDLAIYSSHLSKLVSNTNLDAIFWANIVSGTVRLECIEMNRQ